MADNVVTGEIIRSFLQECCDNPDQCGFEPFIMMKDPVSLRRMSLSEEVGPSGENFRTVLMNSFFSILRSQYISKEAEYVDGRQLADNQKKYLILEQTGEFTPFLFLNHISETAVFSPKDLNNAKGLIFKIRKGNRTIWLYQHMWSIMVPNKKKTNIMARLQGFENHVIFAEQTEQLLTIPPKVDILIFDNHLITNKPGLLQEHYGFQSYIYQAANQSIQSIISKELVLNSEKLIDYISRGKPKYAKKMMRIGSSKVFNLSKERLLQKITTLDRWKGKFHIDEQSEQIELKTFVEVESLIDLFDERYTRSDVTETEYDTDVKSVATPIS